MQPLHETLHQSPVGTTPVFRVQQRTDETPSGTQVTVLHVGDSIRVIPSE